MIRRAASIRDHRAKRFAAFTLAELMVAMAVLSMLVGAAASAIFISTRSIPDGKSLVNRRMDATAALEQIAEELLYATAINSTGISSGEIHSIVFEVDDRGHGAAGVETIRYAWSGASGDPLIRQYNGGGEQTVLDRLDEFVIALGREEEPLNRMPVVLIVVSNSASPSAQSAKKRALMESWGFAVRYIASSASQAAFDTAASGVDALYLANEVSIGSILTTLVQVLTPTKQRSFPMGVVTEMGTSYSGIGISTSYSELGSGSQLNIVNGTHFITKVFGAGTLNAFTGSTVPVKATGTLAPGGVVLAEAGGSVALMAIDYDAQLSNGSIAAARIVKLPWAGSAFDIDYLAAKGEILMRRAIVWASTPMVYANATIKLQLTDDPSATLRSKTKILNRPQ